MGSYEDDWTIRDTTPRRGHANLQPNRYRREWKPSAISTALLIGGGVLFALFMVFQIGRCAIQQA